MLLLYHFTRLFRGFFTDNHYCFILECRVYCKMKKTTKKHTLLTALLLASALLLSRPLYSPNRPTPPTPEVTITPNHPKPISADSSASTALQTKPDSGAHLQMP
jgi:hypothetical protein